MKDETGMGASDYGQAVDMVAAVKAVAANVCTPRAAVSLLRAAYDSVTVHIPGPDRKAWGRAEQLITTGWNDRLAVTEAGRVLHGLVGQLVDLTKRFCGTPGGGPFVSVVVALAYISVATHAMQGRADELGREREPAGAAEAKTAVHDAA
jgi:hypothetical protein